MTTELASKVKDLIVDPVGRIKLDDLVSERLRYFLESTGPEQFPVQASNIQPEEFALRLKKYEAAVQELQTIVILLARWGDEDHLRLLEKVLKRAAEGAERESAGVTMWLHLGWYPLHLLVYSAGVSAVAIGKYPALKVALETPVTFRNTTLPVVIPAVANISDLQSEFKKFPGLETRHTPRSDYLHDLLHPILEEALFLGKDYSEAFNEYEAYLALAYSSSTPHMNGPMGRFAWNRNYEDESTALNRLVATAKKEGDTWPPFAAGMFRSRESFTRAAANLEERQQRIGWD